LAVLPTDSPAGLTAAAAAEDEAGASQDTKLVSVLVSTTVSMQCKHPLSKIPSFPA
jgi:hypothetical protein